ncbi:MAG: DUF4268 domain-containing protein [Saprospiraceae bacterium]
MFSREEASRIRRDFWTTFGQYLRPIPGAEGGKVNWVNYKTGFRKLHFRMDVDREQAYIGIVFMQKDDDLRQLFYEQMEELRPVFHATMEEEWTWVQQAETADGQPFSHVFTTLTGVNIFRADDWPDIIAFLKPRILLLDEFWSLARYHFDLLEEY